MNNNIVYYIYAYNENAHLQYRQKIKETAL